MNTLEISTDKKVDTIFNNYPNFVKDKMLFLRNLVLETAKETEEIHQIEETLKWGEPSFITKQGSTLRMDWKPKLPNQYAMYFSCSSRLIDTFKMVFPNTFHYEGKRAIVFQLDEEIAIEELKQCIQAALMYHKVKQHISLGL